MRTLSLLLFLLLVLLYAKVALSAWNLASTEFSSPTFALYSGWSYNSLALTGSVFYACSTQTIFGGPNVFGTSTTSVQTKITQSVISLPTHSLIRLQFTAYGFNQWKNTGVQINDKLMVYDFISGNLLASISFDDSNKSQVCQTSFYENKVVLTQIFAHSASTLQIQIYAITTYTSSLQSWGIRDYSLSYAQSTQCPQSCAICDNVGNCQECYPGFLLTATTLVICVTTCPDGYYNGTTNCISCHSTCKTCTGPLFNDCLSCNTAIYTFFSSKNTCECLNHHYYNSPGCFSCDPSCDSCSNATSCLSCLEGYYSTGGSLCSPCDETCLSCSTSPSVCSTCSTSKNRYQLSTTCPCLDGYFERTSSLFFDSTLTRADYSTSSYGSCIKCSTGCLLCTDEQSCTRCVIGDNRVLLNGVCKCKQLYRENVITGKCVKYEPAGSTAMSATVSTLAGVALVGALPSVILNNPACLLSMLDIIQVLKYILYIDVLYPDIVVSFFHLFDWTDGSFLGDIISNDAYIMRSPSGFYLNEIDSLFIRNSGYNLVFFPSLILFYLVCKYLPKYLIPPSETGTSTVVPGLTVNGMKSKLLLNEKVLEKTNKWIIYLSQKLNWVLTLICEWMEFGVFLGCVETVYLNLSVFSFLQLQNGSITEFVELLSFVFAIIAVGVLMNHFLVVYHFIRKAPVRVINVLVSSIDGSQSLILAMPQEVILPRTAKQLQQDQEILREDYLGQRKVHPINDETDQILAKHISDEDDQAARDRKKIEQEQLSMERQYKILISLFVQGGLKQRGYYLWMCIHRLVFSFCLVFMYEEPILILSCWMALNLTTIYFLKKYRPFRENIYNYREIICEVCFLAIHAITIPLADKSIDKNDYLGIGWTIISLSLVVIVVQVFCLLRDGFMQLRQFFRQLIPIPATPIIPATPTHSREPLPPLVLTEYQKLKIDLTKQKEYIKLADPKGNPLSTDNLPPATRDHLRQLEAQMTAADTDIELQNIQKKYQEALFMAALQQRLEQFVTEKPRSKKILSDEINELLPVQFADFTAKKSVQTGQDIPMYVGRDDIIQFEKGEMPSNQGNQAQANNKNNKILKGESVVRDNKEVIPLNNLNTSQANRFIEMQQIQKQDGDINQLQQKLANLSTQQEALISTLPTKVILERQAIAEAQSRAINSMAQTKTEAFQGANNTQLNSPKKDRNEGESPSRRAQFDQGEEEAKFNGNNSYIPSSENSQIQSRISQNINSEFQKPPEQGRRLFKQNNSQLNKSIQPQQQQQLNEIGFYDNSRIVNNDNNATNTIYQPEINEISAEESSSPARLYKKKQQRQIRPVNASRVESIGAQLEQLDEDQELQ